MPPPLAFVAGVCILQLPTDLPPLSAVAGVTCVLCVRFHSAVQNYRQRFYARTLAILILLLLGLFYATWRADMRIDSTLPNDLHWKEIAVAGTVIDTPQVDHRRTRFRFAIEEMLAPHPQALEVNAQISHYHNGKTPSPDIQEGARLQMKVKLREPRTNFNPHGFDSARYYFTKNIRLRGYVRGGITPLAEPTPLGWNDWRTQLHHRIINSGAPATHLIAALVVGERDGMSDDDWRLLRRTGTIHLFSISGLHIGYVFLLVGALAAFIWRLPFLYTRIPRLRFATWGALPFALAYALISGWGVPVQRSFFMVLVGALLIVAGGSVSARTVLSLVMFVVVLIDPWAVLSIGFWLSFAFVAMIYFIAINQPSQQPVWYRLTVGQCLLSLFAIPLTLWFFNEASLISPLANAIAIPTIGILVLPLSLAGIGLGDWCWHIAGEILEYLWQVMIFLSALPYAAWTPAPASLWMFAVAGGGLVWMLMPRGIPYRYLGVLPLLAVLLYCGNPPAVGDARIAVLDVGQGNAVVVRTHKNTLVYDTGPAWGGRVIADYLRGEGVKHIDRLIISHNNADHSGGLEYLQMQKDISIGTLYTHESDARCKREDEWEWDDVVFTMLHPAPGFTADNTNDQSCVVRIDTPHGLSMLLTGDITDEVEEILLPDLQPASVLLVAHHGSNTSTSEEFVQAVNPELAVISVGATNRHKHPHKDVLQRLRHHKILRTDQHGAIIIHFIGDEVQTKTWRATPHLRYWHQQ